MSSVKMYEPAYRYVAASTEVVENASNNIYNNESTVDASRRQTSSHADLKSYCRKSRVSTTMNQQTMTESITRNQMNSIIQSDYARRGNMIRKAYLHHHHHHRHRLHLRKNHNHYRTTSTNYRSISSLMLLLIYFYILIVTICSPAVIFVSSKPNNNNELQQHPHRTSVSSSVSSTSSISSSISSQQQKATTIPMEQATADTTIFETDDEPFQASRSNTNSNNNNDQLTGDSSLQLSASTSNLMQQQLANSNTTFSCPEQFGYYTDGRDCAKYYVCVFGEVLHESCTGGLRFSKELQTCDWPRNVDCPQGSPSTDQSNQLPNNITIQDSSITESTTPTTTSTTASSISVTSSRHQQQQQQLQSSTSRLDNNNMASQNNDDNNQDEENTGSNNNSNNNNDNQHQEHPVVDTERTQPQKTSATNNNPLKHQQQEQHPSNTQTMAFADEGSDPQQPSFDEAVSPVITPDGSIHLHDGQGGTFGLTPTHQAPHLQGQSPWSPSSNFQQLQPQQQHRKQQQQGVDIFVKPLNVNLSNKQLSTNNSPFKNQHLSASQHHGAIASQKLSNIPSKQVISHVAPHDHSHHGQHPHSHPLLNLPNPQQHNNNPNMVFKNMQQQQPASQTTPLTHSGSSATTPSTTLSNNGDNLYDPNSDDGSSGQDQDEMRGQDETGSSGDQLLSAQEEAELEQQQAAQSEPTMPPLSERSGDNVMSHLKHSSTAYIPPVMQGGSSHNNRATQQLHHHIQQLAPIDTQDAFRPVMAIGQNQNQNVINANQPNQRNQQQQYLQQHHQPLATTNNQRGALSVSANQSPIRPNNLHHNMTHQQNHLANINNPVSLREINRPSRMSNVDQQFLASAFDQNSSAQNQHQAANRQQQQSSFSNNPFKQPQSTSQLINNNNPSSQIGSTQNQNQFISTGNYQQQHVARSQHSNNQNQANLGHNRNQDQHQQAITRHQQNSFNSIVTSSSSPSNGLNGQGSLNLNENGSDQALRAVQIQSMSGQSARRPRPPKRQQIPSSSGRNPAQISTTTTVSSPRPPTTSSLALNNLGPADFLPAHIGDVEEETLPPQQAQPIQDQPPIPTLVPAQLPAHASGGPRTFKQQSVSVVGNLKPATGSAQLFATSPPAPTINNQVRSQQPQLRQQQQPSISTSSLRSSISNNQPINSFSMSTSNNKQQEADINNNFGHSTVLHGDQRNSNNNQQRVNLPNSLQPALIDQPITSLSTSTSISSSSTTSSSSSSSSPVSQSPTPTSTTSRQAFPDAGVGQPFGTIDYDFDILANENGTDRRPTSTQVGRIAGNNSAGRSARLQDDSSSVADGPPDDHNGNLAGGEPSDQPNSQNGRVSVSSAQRTVGSSTGGGNRANGINIGIPAGTQTTPATPLAASGSGSGPSGGNPKKPRPSNKKISVNHELALANNRASMEPARRPEAIFTQPVALQTATKCDNRICRLPDCKCGDTLNPGNLDSKTIPQVVLLTFDDAVNDLNWEIYEELFNGRVNPNGCPILATFYVSHEWTDYGQVQTLYSRGHEMASHSVTHSFGEKFSKSQWFKEINGQREILNLYGGVKMNDVRGMRAPFLQVGGNKMFEMLYDANFTYDSSMPIFENSPPLWPYTLDYQLSHECMITPCPTRSFPGVWEVGMTMWVDLRGGRCSMGDACSNPADEEGVYEMLMKNFNRHYKSNRAPFGLFYHSAWFNTVHHRRGFLRFLQTVNAMPDVFFVTNWQMLQWMRKPTPLSEINTFEPWQCPSKSDRPPPCFHPSVCNVKSEHGTRFMKTCQPCPANQQYPWVGATGFNKAKQAANAGSG